MSAHGYLDDDQWNAREQLEERLLDHLNDREWQALKDEKRIPADILREEQLDELVEVIQERRGIWTTVGGAPITVERSPGADAGAGPGTSASVGELAIPEEDDRLSALAEILVQQARKDTAVQDFRTQRLPDGLLTPLALPEWMWRQAQTAAPGLIERYLHRSMTIPVSGHLMAEALTALNQGKPDEKIEIPVPEKLQIPATLHVTAAELAASAPRKVYYYLAQKAVVASVPRGLGADGLLDELVALGERLAADYGWSEAEAVTFVLTDRTPRIIAARYTIAANRQGIPALARIQLTLDPGVAPQRVAEVYRSVRQRALPGGRVRDLSAKHRMLALFAAQHAPNQMQDQSQRQRADQEQDSSWSVDELMAAWNAAHPDMCYHKRSFFERDCRLARARLLQQPDK